MENRNYQFLSKEFSMDRVEEVLKYTCSKLDFKEICKLFIEICYDQVAYYSNDLCSSIYKDNKRSKLNVEQCNRLQQKVSTAVDLFEQAIVDGRTFDEGYLEERLGK